MTSCPYKGTTSAWFSTGPQLPTAVADVAWTYTTTTPGLAAIAGLVAFFDELVDVTVDGVRRERPRTHLAGPG